MIKVTLEVRVDRSAGVRAAVGGWLVGLGGAPLPGVGPGRRTLLVPTLGLPSLVLPVEKAGSRGFPPLEGFLPFPLGLIHSVKLILNLTNLWKCNPISSYSRKRKCDNNNFGRNVINKNRISHPRSGDRGWDRSFSDMQIFFIYFWFATRSCIFTENRKFV